MKRELFYWLYFLIVLSSCLESPTMTSGIVNGKEKPTVLTLQHTSIPTMEGRLLLRGEIASMGKSNKVIEKGFYWSTTSNDPSSSDSIIVVSDASDDIFYYELKASGNKTYFWRAYAKNEHGYDYGDVKSYQTPEIWKEKAFFPPISRGKGAIFVVDNKIYITCGIKGSSGNVFVNETWEYNILDNRWKEVKEFIGEPRRYPVAFTLGNLAFVGTGQKASAIVYNDFFQYDNISNEWTKIPDNSDLHARDEAVAFRLNGKGYLVGGLLADGSSLNDVWRYTHSEGGGVWEKMNDFPVHFSGGISICGNENVFVGLGENLNSKRTLWKYEEENDRWEEFVRLPDEIEKKIYSGVIIQNTIYIVDGNNVIWSLDISDKIWKRKTELPPEFLSQENEENQSLITTGTSNSIYVGLGFTSYFYEYRPLWDNN
jgi:N-acetylneuraminic acid mutarotase